MEFISVDEHLISKRLDIALASHPSIQSRSEAKKLINSGNVFINNHKNNAKAKYILKAGDTILFEPVLPVPVKLVPVAHPLDIIHEDDHLLVVNKPVGMVVHPAPGHPNDTLVNYLLHHTNLSAVNDIRPGIVHRIDKDTSGLLVVAKDNATHEHLASQFFNHSIKREYQAIIWGIPEEEIGTIDAPLGRHPVDRKKRAIVQSGKQAITHWTVLEKFNHLSLVECQLETGRTHQIRVHMKSIGHAILGDQIYGKFRNFAQNFPDHVKHPLKTYPSQALHAISLGFIHPKTEKWLTFDSELPQQMTNVLDILREDLQQKNSRN